MSKVWFGLLDVREGAGLEPGAAMGDAGQTVSTERLQPQNFDGELPLRRAPEDARMDDANTGNDVRGFRIAPVQGVVGFDEEVIFSFVIADGFGPGLGQQENIHPGLIPETGQAVQGGFLIVHPDDIAVDGEERDRGDEDEGDE